MLQLTAIPAFNDNYIWALHDDTNCVIVDPGQAKPVINFLHDNNLHLTHILITHHHHDHIGGIDLLVQHSAEPIQIIGPADSRIKQLTTTVSEGDDVTISILGLSFSVLEIPGHTLSHIAFWNDNWLFCGDTLFSAGCGRLFEGTPAQMQQSLDKLAALSGDLLVCCAHEYTLANCHFAIQVEPNNLALQQRCDKVNQLRTENKITLPVRLADELSYNPFLRSRQPAVINAAKQYLTDTNPATVDQLNAEEPHQILAVIRSWKDAA